MEIVSLGKTGLKVSKLCFGTMTFGSSKWKSMERIIWHSGEPVASL